MSDVDTGSLDKPNAPRRRPAACCWKRRAASCATTSCSGHGGRTALARFAERFDGLLRQILDAAPRTEPEPRWPVVAIGGYGRKQLCLHSDIDLLVLFGGHLGEAEERLLRAILHPLWDLGLVVGHQVREIDEFARLEVDNPEFLMALVDARPVAGDLELFRRFESAFHHAGTHAHVVGALNTLIDERYALFNSTLYQLEPERQGRARHAARSDGDPLDRGADRSVAPPAGTGGSRAAGRGRGLPAAGPIDSPPRDEAQREPAQPPAAGKDRRHPRLPGRVPAAARRAADERLLPPRADRHARAELDAQDRADAGRRPTSDRRPTASASSTRGRPPCSRPRGSRRSRRRSTPGATSPTRRWRSSASTPSASASRTSSRRHAHQTALLRFLRPGAGLYARLSEMHDCGVLGRMFPPFQAITCRVVRDFFHKYTVDEHTLLTIKNLERLATRAAPDRERFSSLLQDLEAPELLVLSLLFHDVGKWRDEDHATESVRMAHEMFERLGLSAEQRATVEFLIKNHLAMSQVAFRRDTEDPEIVRTFASLVGVEERLRMLCLMTLADVEAVSLETLTPWRAELLWRLFVDTYNHLTLGYGDELIEPSLAGQHRAAGEPAGGPVGERHLAFPGGAPAAVPAALRSGGDLPPRAAGAQHQPGRSAPGPRGKRARPGSSPSSRSTSRSCSRTSPACCRRSAWTSCAATR